MHLTNGQFTKKLTEHTKEINLLVAYMEAILTTYKKYGKSLFLTRTKDHLKKADNSFSSFLMILKSQNKVHLSDLKKILLLLRKHPAYKKEFSIVSMPWYRDILEKFLTEKYKEIITHYEESSQEKVILKGEGHYYKRTLDDDLKKLLGE